MISFSAIIQKINQLLFYISILMANIDGGINSRTYSTLVIKIFYRML